MTQLAMFDATEKTATISPCGLYRYRLGRRWGEGRPLLFVMLNPSTADEIVPDATIRRCIGFARREGFSAIDVVNLFALRATDPADLRRVADPIGSENDAHIRAAALDAPMVIAGWGALAKIPTAHASRPEHVLRLLHARGPVMHLGLNADGSPKHPLFLRGDAPLGFGLA